jgi:hypothetical protein
MSISGTSRTMLCWDLLSRRAPDTTRHRILVENSESLYGFAKAGCICRCRYWARKSSAKKIDRHHFRSMASGETTTPEESAPGAMREL